MASDDGRRIGRGGFDSVVRHVLRRKGWEGSVAEGRAQVVSEALAKDQPLEKRVARQPIGAVNARAGHLATRVKAWDGGPTPVVHEDSSHVIVGGGGHRDGFGARVETGATADIEDSGEVLGKGRTDAPRVEEDAVSTEDVSGEPPGDDISRGELVPVDVEEESAGPSRRMRPPAPRRASVRRGRGSDCRAGRWDGTGRTRGRRGEPRRGRPWQGHRLWLRQGSSCAPTPARYLRSRARRRGRGRRGIGPLRPGGRTTDSSLEGQESRREGVLEDLDLRPSFERGRRASGDLAAGRVAGVDDSRAAVGRLSVDGEAARSARGRVARRAPVARRDGVGCLVREDLDGLGDRRCRRAARRVGRVIERARRRGPRRRRCRPERAGSPPIALRPPW